MPNALVVDDEKLTLQFLTKLLEDEGFSVRAAASFKDAAEELQKMPPDVLLVDLVLPDGKGLDLVKKLEVKTPFEVVVITGHASVETAVQALKLGATDYLTKPIDVARLKTILKNVLRIRGLQEEIGDLHQKLRQFGNFGPLIGNSPPMQEIYDLIGKVAPTEATVLVIGESGCGKEVVAQTIHQFSRRAKNPFLAVNCGAISPNLIESELFGHEKGSFTNATAMHRGYFERAHTGTLFLDEIAEMPMELQVKLLRVLETGAFTRIGGDQQLQVDVRIFAATNRQPMDAVAKGNLREDLYYRLNVFSIALPPLRDRKGDLDLLAAHFLAEMNRAEKTSKRLSPETMKVLKKYHWPGNVREFKNVLQRAFIIASTEILPDCLSPDIQAAREEKSSQQLCFDLGSPLAEIEQRAILATLEQLGGNRKKTAKMLGINLRTLYNRLKTYGVNGADAEPLEEEAAAEPEQKPV